MEVPRASFKERSRMRRRLLMQQFGVDNDKDYSRILGNMKKTPGTARIGARDECRLSNNRRSFDPPQRNDGAMYFKTFQSFSPHNDYCQHFVDTGQRPQNFIRDVGLMERFDEYPKLKELIRLKDEVVTQTASPPMFLKADLRSTTSTFSLRQLKGKFDVILIEPPLEEDQKVLSSSIFFSQNGDNEHSWWTWEEIESLPLEDIASARSFVFLWVGSGKGLDAGRRCLRKWGFRRCEDICWIKTNKKMVSATNSSNSMALFQRTKEHCLMGIKGTVRRSTDGDFIHSNIDIDLIITEEPSLGSAKGKPNEIFKIIEHFCLGRRRLHLFGQDSTIRPGWLTIGPDLTNSNFNSDVYWKTFEGTNGHLTGSTDKIDILRPKSPPPRVNEGK